MNAIIIHGTEGYPEENWFPWLKRELEQIGCKVSVPHFPSPPVVPAKIAEWFSVLENFEIDQNTIIVGHSLGGVFALRVLEKLNFQVKGAILTGTPVGEKPLLNFDRDVAFSGFNFDWPKIKKNAKSFAVFHSDNDPYVCIANGEKLARELDVPMTFIPNAGHFNKKAGYTKFPEVLELIKEWRDETN